jgi:amino acid permease
MSSGSIAFADSKSSTTKPGLVAQHAYDFDVEDGSSDDANNEQLKRGLGARHINMIAIAGMIVGLSLFSSPSGC